MQPIVISSLKMDNIMKLQHIESPDNDLMIKLSGEMDALGCSKIRPDLEAIASNNHRHIIVDIHQISFIDSSGIGAIVFLFKRLKEQDRTMEIIGVQGQPRELMTLLRISSAIQLTVVETTNTQPGDAKCIN